MPASAPTLKYQVFMRGLAGGIVVLAISSFLWFSATIWYAVCAQAGLDPFSAADRVDFPAVWLLPNFALAAILAVASIQVRRKAPGFQSSDLRNADPGFRHEHRRLRNRFLANVAAEWIVIGVGINLANHFHRQDLVWPCISLAVCLHFAPLAFYFRVRPYYVTAVVGGLVSLIAMIAPTSPARRLLFVSAGVGATFWITGAYVALRADRLADSWDQPRE